MTIRGRWSRVRQGIAGWAFTVTGEDPDTRRLLSVRSLMPDDKFVKIQWVRDAILFWHEQEMWRAFAEKAECRMPGIVSRRAYLKLSARTLADAYWKHRVNPLYVLSAQPG